MGEVEEKCGAEHQVSVHGSADDWVTFVCQRTEGHIGLHEDRWLYVIRPEELPEDVEPIRHEAVLTWTGDYRKGDD